MTEKMAPDYDRKETVQPSGGISGKTGKPKTKKLVGASTLEVSVPLKINQDKPSG